MKRHAAIFFAVQLLCASWQRAAEDKVSIGTHALYYSLSGRGEPLVVIDVGAGKTSASWREIVSQLSKTTSVLVYDRAGYGKSDPGPLPRNCRRAAEKLKALLDRIKAKGPFLLVGHSLGALNLQLFAHLFPRTVHGMVLLDPTPRGWLSGTSFPALKKLFQQTSEEFLATAKILKSSPDREERKKAHFFMALYSEHREMFLNSNRQLDTIRSFAAIPLTVVAAGRPNPNMGADAEAFQKYWVEENRRLASLSTRGKFVFLEGCSHQIPSEQPDRVVVEVQALLKKR